MKKIKNYAISLLIMTTLAYALLTIFDIRMQQINKKELSTQQPTTTESR